MVRRLPRGLGRARPAGQAVTCCPTCGTPLTQYLEYADLRMDVDAGEVHRGGRPIVLSPRPYDLLRYFMEHPRVRLSKTRLYNGVWGADLTLSSNSLEMQISLLRRRLGEPRLIHTVYGSPVSPGGYVLR